MDIEGTVSKFLNPLEKHSTLIGVGVGGLGLIGAFQDDINQIMIGHVHAPEYNNLIDHWIVHTPYMTAYAGAIGGYLAKEATSNPMIRRVADIAMKISIGWLAINYIQDIINVSTHSPAGSTMNQPNRADYRENYTGRPTAGSGHSQFAGAQLKGN